MKPTARTTATTWIILALAGGGSFMLPESLPAVTPPPRPAILIPRAPRVNPPVSAASAAPTDPTEADRAGDRPDETIEQAASAMTDD